MFALLLGAWLAAGLFGRDPWKPDEAYTFGLVHHIVASGDWVVPTLAGEPFMEKPPLFFVSAALFAQAFGAGLALPDAMRLACALYAGLTLLFVALAARELYGRDTAVAAALLLMGCIGYFHTAHLLVTDNALVAGVAIALYGLAAHARPWAGGLALGTGAGIAFLAKGLIGPGLIGLSAAALLALPAWRTRAFARTLVIAALAAMPWIVAWPFALYQRSPELFREWLVVNNFGRYTGAADLGPEHDHWMYLRILPWFALPALPLALWTACRTLRTRDARAAMPLICALVMLVVLSSACNSRYLYALPLLVPLAIAAAPSVARVPQWLGRGLLWLGAALGAVAALALWGAWAALLVQWPSALTDTLLAFRPGFAPAVSPILMLTAIAATLGALFAVPLAWRSAERVAGAWAIAATLAWTLFFTLWLPYQDYGNSYRGLVAELRSRLPRGSYCIANRDLGEPQRAMLEYHGAIVTRSEQTKEARDCALLIVQQQGYAGALPPHDARWSPLWSGARPGDTTERLWLFGSAQLVAKPELEEVDARVRIADARVGKVLQPQR